MIPLLLKRRKDTPVCPAETISRPVFPFSYVSGRLYCFKPIS